MLQIPFFQWCYLAFEFVLSRSITYKNKLDIRETEIIRNKGL